MALMEVADQQVNAGTTPEAFRDLFDTHARTIYNFLFRRTADWALAEDLTSVVFLEAWRRRAARPDLPFLYGVATNVLRNQRRSLRRHRAALERVPTPRPTDDFADDLVSRLDDERTMRSLLSALGSLSPDDRDVL